MLPAGPLMIEHRLIEQAVSLIEKESEIIRSGGKLDLPLLTSMIDFMVYADRCHHGKEEEITLQLPRGKDMDEEHREMMSVLIDDHRRSGSDCRAHRAAGILPPRRTREPWTTW